MNYLFKTFSSSARQVRKKILIKEDSNRFVDSPTFTAGNDVLERSNTNHTVKIHYLFFKNIPLNSGYTGITFRKESWSMGDGT